MDAHKLMLDVTHILLVKDEMKSAGGIEGWHTTCLSKSWVKDDKECSVHSQPVDHGIMELPGSSITHSLLVTLDVMWILVVMMCCSLSVGYGVRAISVPGKRWSGCSLTSCWTWDDKQLRLLKIGNCYLLPIIDETQLDFQPKIHSHSDDHLLNYDMNAKQSITHFLFHVMRCDTQDSSYQRKAVLLTSC